MKFTKLTTREQFEALSLPQDALIVYRKGPGKTYGLRMMNATDFAEVASARNSDEIYEFVASQPDLEVYLITPGETATIYVISLIGEGFLKCSFVTHDIESAIVMATVLLAKYYDERDEDGYIAIEVTEPAAPSSPLIRILQLDLNEDPKDAEVIERIGAIRTKVVLDPPKDLDVRELTVYSF